MKTCPQCKSLNEDSVRICVVCGGELPEAVPEEAVLPRETEAEEIVEPAAPAASAKKLSKGALIGIIAAVVVVIAAIIIAVTVLGKKDAQLPAVPEDIPEEAIEASTPISAGHHINAHGLPSHSIHFEKNEDGTFSYSYLNEKGETKTLSQADVDKLMAQEVASCAGTSITNGDVMFYYDDQMYNFTTTYSQYLSFMMDSTKALDEQIGMDGVNTWEQLFVDSGMQMFHQVAALAAHARAEGFTLPAEAQTAVDTMESQLDATAQAYGFADALSYLQAYFGPSATLENYLKFYENNVYVNAYLTEQQSAIEISDEDAEAYYTANETTLTETYGIQKIDKNVVNVRHILVQPESTTAEDGSTSISEEAWAAAESRAQSLYEEWKKGEATEETFAQLATDNTQDPGSQSSGGLYNDVYPGQMVTEFNDWCFADERQVGDHGVVKTSYGYHIMFFSGEGDFVYWKAAVADMMVGEQMNEFIANVRGGQELTADQSKVVLLNATAPSVPAAETEAPAAEETPAQ